MTDDVEFSGFARILHHFRRPLLRPLQPLQKATLTELRYDSSNVGYDSRCYVRNKVEGKRKLPL